MTRALASLCKMEWSKDELIMLVDTFKQKEGVSINHTLPHRLTGTNHSPATTAVPATLPQIYKPHTHHTGMLYRHWVGNSASTPCDCNCFDLSNQCFVVYGVICRWFGLCFPCHCLLQYFRLSFIWVVKWMLTTFLQFTITLVQTIWASSLSEFIILFIINSQCGWCGWCFVYMFRLVGPMRDLYWESGRASTWFILTGKKYLTLIVCPPSLPLQTGHGHSSDEAMPKHVWLTCVMVNTLYVTHGRCTCATV